MQIRRCPATVIRLIINKSLSQNAHRSAKSWTKKKTRLMFFLSTNNDEINVENFNLELARQKLEEGYPVVTFWCDRIYKNLQNSLKDFRTKNQES